MSALGRPYLWPSERAREILHPPVSESALSLSPCFPLSLCPSFKHHSHFCISFLYIRLYAYTPIHKDMFPFRTTQKQGWNHLVILCGCQPPLTACSRSASRPPHVTRWLYRLRTPSSRGTESQPALPSHLCAVQSQHPTCVLPPLSLPWRGTQYRAETGWRWNIRDREHLFLRLTLRSRQQPHRWFGSRWFGRFRQTISFSQVQTISHRRSTQTQTQTQAQKAANPTERCTY